MSRPSPFPLPPRAGIYPQFSDDFLAHLPSPFWFDPSFTATYKTGFLLGLNVQITPSDLVQHQQLLVQRMNCQVIFTFSNSEPADNETTRAPAVKQGLTFPQTLSLSDFIAIQPSIFSHLF